MLLNVQVLTSIHLIGTLEQREKLHRENLRAKKVIWDEEQRKIASKRTRGMSLAHKISFVLIDIKCLFFRATAATGQGDQRAYSGRLWQAVSAWSLKFT